MEQQSDTTTSMFVDLDTVGTVVQSAGSESEVISTSGHNLLLRVLRYGRWWVLKGLKPEFRHQYMYVAALRKEFDVLVHLQHPNIVSAFEWEEVEDLGPAIVMEWVDGVTLKEWMSVKHSSDEKSQVLRQLLAAIDYIHGQQVAHRDLKPSNIMVTRNGNRVKLIDFGVSDTDSHAFLKQPAGTCGYMSPQQLTEAVTDQRNDLYSVGCVVEQMRMGWIGRHIARRCKAPLAKRYVSVGDVLTDWQRMVRWARFIRWGIVCIALLFIVWLAVGHGSSEENLPTPMPPKSVASKKTKVTSGVEEEKALPSVVELSPSLSKPTVAVPQMQTENFPYEDALTEAFEQGKKMLDEDVRKNGIVQRFDTLTNASWMWQDFSDWMDDTNKLVADVAKTFVDRLTPKDADALYANLMYYMNEQYYQPLNLRLVELQYNNIQRSSK